MDHRRYSREEEVELVSRMREIETAALDLLDRIPTAKEVLDDFKRGKYIHALRVERIPLALKECESASSVHSNPEYRECIHQAKCLWEESSSIAWSMALAETRVAEHEAKKYIGVCRRSPLTLEDLVHEGLNGIMRAVLRWSPEHAVRISTFARHWCNASIRRLVYKNAFVIQMPDRVQNIRFRIRRLNRNEDTDGWTDDDYAEALGVSVDDARLAMMDYSSDPLDKQIFDGGGGRTISDVIPDDDIDVFEDVMYQTQAEKLREALRSDILSDRSRQVLYHRYALEGKKAKTYAAIGEIFGISRERVRQIILKAEEKIRRHIMPDMKVTDDYILERLQDPKTIKELSQELPIGNPATRSRVQNLVVKGLVADSGERKAYGAIAYVASGQANRSPQPQAEGLTNPMELAGQFNGDDPPEEVQDQEKAVTIEVTITPRIASLLQELVDTGFYGFTVEHAAERLIALSLAEKVCDKINPPPAK